MTTKPEDLAPDDRLVFLIGSACINDVYLETMLRMVWLTLAGPMSRAIALTPRDAGTLINECIAMAKLNHRPSVDPHLVDALQEAKAAHEERNRVVHDKWIRVQEERDVPSWSRVRSAKGFRPGQADKKTLADVEQVAMGLLHAMYRLIGADTLLGDFPDEDPRDVAEALAILRGDFVMAPNGGITLVPTD